MSGLDGIPQYPSRVVVLLLENIQQLQSIKAIAT